MFTHFQLHKLKRLSKSYFNWCTKRQYKTSQVEIEEQRFLIIFNQNIQLKKIAVRMQRESQYRGGEDTSRKMLEGRVAGAPAQEQNAVINWLKIIGLLFFTFGLIALMWVISNAIEHMKGPGSGSIYSSFVDAGGLILGMFLFYVLAFGVAWYCGYQKRDQLRREAVEKQISRDRANNALNNIE